MFFRGLWCRIGIHDDDVDDKEYDDGDDDRHRVCVFLLPVRQRWGLHGDFCTGPCLHAFLCKVPVINFNICSLWSRVPDLTLLRDPNPMRSRTQNPEP